MDVTCGTCGKTWDARDPDVWYQASSGEWFCRAEDECYERLIESGRLVP
jgi:hypothetical protein